NTRRDSISPNRSTPRRPATCCAPTHGARSRPAPAAESPRTVHSVTQTAGAPVIRVSGCRKTYGPLVAVHDVSFDVYDGEIFGLIGPNGAGKTTTMECVEGLRRPDAGTISVLGMDPIRNIYALQERIGVQLQQAHL